MDELTVLQIVVFCHVAFTFLKNLYVPGRVVQSVMCLATSASQTADPGVACSIWARSNTFVENDHEIFSTAILLPSAESIKKGCCQLQAKVCTEVLVNCLFKLAQEEVWLLTWQQNKQTNKQTKNLYVYCYNYNLSEKTLYDMCTK